MKRGGGKTEEVPIASTRKHSQGFKFKEGENQSRRKNRDKKQRKRRTAQMVPDGEIRLTRRGVGGKDGGGGIL